MGLSLCTISNRSMLHSLGADCGSMKYQRAINTWPTPLYSLHEEGLAQSLESTENKTSTLHKMTWLNGKSVHPIEIPDGRGRYACIYMFLRMGSRASHMLRKFSATELNTQPLKVLLIFDLYVCACV